MSRIASQAVGGFFKTQDEILPLIFRRFAAIRGVGDFCVVDPCAGEGEAVTGFIDHVFGPLSGRRRQGFEKEATAPSVSLVMVELEQERYQQALQASRRCCDDREVHLGDGLACDATGEGASLLWLNPPYDFFRGRRFEARFLDAWTGRVTAGGQLVLIVPEHVLSYLATTLTCGYDDLEILRYPEPTYSQFRQVVVLGTKRALAGEARQLPPIGDLAVEPPTPRRLPPGGLKVDVNGLDVNKLLDATTPWGSIAGYDRAATAPQIGLAMRPKPAHIAMALGSGVFNGIRLAAPGRADLLAKAVFVRHFVDQEAKTNINGEVVKLTQVERPQLRLTILDLESGDYRELSSGTQPSSSGEIENFADLLLAYGDSMVAAMRERCPSLHNGEEDIVLPAMSRTLFQAQATAVRAALKLIDRGSTPLILGEVGAGKTCVSIQILWAIHNKVHIPFTSSPAFPPKTLTPHIRRALVVCPPHLVQNWIDEMRACLPNIPVRVLERCSDVDAISTMPDDLVVAVLSRETAKLSHGVEGIMTKRCPRCHNAVAETAEKLATFRAVCQSSLAEPCDALARIAHSMSSLHRRGVKWDSETFASLRRAAAAPLLRYIKNHTTRLKQAWRTQQSLLSWENQQKVIEIAKLCGADIRILKCLRLAKVGGHDGYLLKDFTHKIDDFALMSALQNLGTWKTRVCGERLYQAAPTPRRYPLADYITRKHVDLFQLIVVDEAHEYSASEDAQSRAIHSLCEKIPLKLPLTGSLMNGYAKSLFRNMWSFSRRMREEFAYDEGTKFAKLYGYQKRVLTGDALVKAKTIEFGSASNRVTKTEGGERLSDAPGVLPSFVLRHILPLSVTLHKRDIVPDDRVVDHDRQEIALDGELASRGAHLGTTLLAAIKRDRFDPFFSGKLFGQLAEYPSYFDRATGDTGNAGSGGCRRFDICYPTDVGGAVVASAEGLPAQEWLPKEQWLLATLQSELSEGRNVLVFLWHKDLSERLRRLVQAAGEVAAFLDADKVPARKRQDWIDKNVVGKRRVMITNPTCVQTGLNNLIWFSTAIFVENPGCNPFVARQAVGRLDRITQTKDVRVYWPVYEGVQAKLLDLLQAKTAISQQIDGIDPTAALEMAGGGDANVQVQDVGVAIYKYLGGD